MNPLALFLLVLITWRLANLVANETGPFHIFRRLRFYVRALCIWGPRGFRAFHAYELISCEYCNSVWLGTVLTLAYWFFNEAVLWFGLPLALSAGTILTKRLHERMQR